MKLSQKPQLWVVSRKFQFLLFLILILINILLRYPFTPHEIGWDSYVIHSLGESINTQQHAAWTLNPLSYAGMYPMSYPSAVPFLLSSTSQLTGLNIEAVAWVFTVIIGIIAAIGAFILAGAIKRDFWFQYIVALAFSTSMGLLLFTTWTLSTRGFLVVIIPIFLWGFISYIKEYETKYLIISILFLFLLATSHRMFVLIIPFLFLYFMLYVVLRFKYNMKSHMQEKKQIRLRKVISLLLIVAVGLLILVPALGPFTGLYQGIVVDKSITGWLVWTGAVFARNVGPIALFSLIGFVLLANKIGKNREELFILGSLAFVAPMFLVGKYASTFSLIFLFILAGFGITLLLKSTHKKKKMVCLIVGIVISSSLIASGYGQVSSFDILSEENTIDARYLENEGYDAAIWAKLNEIDTMTGSRPLTERISAISGIPHFPGNEPQNLVYGFASPEDMVIKQRSPFDLKFYLDAPIIDEERINDFIVWRGGVLSRTPVQDETAIGLINLYNLENLVVNNYDTEHSVFEQSVMYSKFCIFNNQKASIYLL